MTTQPEALRLADQLDLYGTGDAHQRGIEQAADELRRLHSVAQPAQVTRGWSLRYVYFDENGIPLMHREPEQSNFCPRCGKRTKDIHTCTPPQENT